MPRAVVYALVCALGLGPAALLRADEPSAADTQAAKNHYRAGADLYGRARYSEAITEFQEAYRLSHAPALLYNIAQAYEKMDDLANARTYLQRYVDSGQADPAELPALRERLKSLDAKIGPEEKPTETAAPAPAPETQP